jgi:prepilin-type N-terminal cleavage/methylation domain-containing protein
MRRSTSPTSSTPHTATGFSLLEVLVCITVIAVLVSMLLPTLGYARDAGYRAVCSNNLRQMNVGWQGYLQDHKETFPVAQALPEWTYGGVSFVGLDKTPRLDDSRPINRYLSSAQSAGDIASDASKLFHCPSDAGVWERQDQTKGPGFSILGQAGGETCYGFFGNSYSANPRLMNASIAGVDGATRALRLADIQSDTSRLLVAGDAAWKYATSTDSTRRLEASWHRTRDCGNFLAADGSIRFVNFARSGSSIEFTLSPLP